MNGEISLALGNYSFSGIVREKSRSGNYAVLEVKEDQIATMYVEALNTGTRDGNFKLVVHGGTSSSVISIPAGQQRVIQVSLPIGSADIKDYAMNLVCSDDSSVTPSAVYTVRLEKYVEVVADDRSFRMVSHQLMGYKNLLSSSGTSYNAEYLAGESALLSVVVENTGNVRSSFYIHVSEENYSSVPVAVDAGNQVTLQVSLPLADATAKNYIAYVKCASDGARATETFNIQLSKYIQAVEGKKASLLKNYSFNGIKEVLSSSEREASLLVDLNTAVTMYLEVANTGDVDTHYKVVSSDGVITSESVLIPAQEQRIVNVPFLLSEAGKKTYVLDAVSTSDPSVRSENKITVSLTDENPNPLHVIDQLEVVAYSFVGDAEFEAYSVEDGIGVINILKNDDNTLKTIFDVKNYSDENITVNLRFEGSYVANSEAVLIPAHQKVAIPLSLVLLGDDQVNVVVRESEAESSTRTLLKMKCKDNPNSKTEGFKLLSFTL